ncbi:MAG TPA: hypothetical protein VNA16_08615 [Abditibacteriaceae bacterium]|nr:hypothetical protein [Abditibacteriaceae bacterium]
MTNDHTLIGHGPRWAALARAFAKGEAPQTLLISGPPQIGKWTFALRYAQLLLCPDVREDAEGLLAPCGHCRVCHQVEIETFPDFVVMRPVVAAAKDSPTAPEDLDSSVILIEMARDFSSEAMRSPLVGKRKVMVINQADRMTPPAQNSLLKTLEEPGHGYTMLLLASNPYQLLPTIISRCWQLPLGLAPDEEITLWLGEEFSDAPPHLVNEAVRVAAGRPGAAWRELRRLQRAPANAKNSPKTTKQDLEQEQDAAEPEATVPRAIQAGQIVERIAQSQPVAALALTEEALRLARLWWADDQAEEVGAGAKKELKADAKVLRSAVARFLDELATAYRTYWTASLQTVPAGARQTAADAGVWADGLDQIRKTRHYILRNANTNLALDVMFGRLIAAHSTAAKPVRAR